MSIFLKILGSRNCVATAVLYFMTCTLLAQIEVTPVSQVNLEADQYIGTDSYGAIYYLKNNVLHKKDGTQSYQYSNLLLGELKEVHITNPLKVVLFYELANTVVLIDKFPERN